MHHKASHVLPVRRRNTPSAVFERRREMIGMTWLLSRGGVGVGAVVAALSVGCSPDVDLGATGDSGGGSSSDDAGTATKDAANHLDAVDGADSAASTPGEGGAPESGGYTLTVTFTGFDYPPPPDGGETVLHIDVLDETANTTMCAGGSSLGVGFTGEVYTYGPSVAAPGLLLGHSYSFGYAINSDNFVGCVSGDPNADGSPYYYHLFGPVTGDVSLTATPADPMMK
jgi:hypothetical protein